MILILESFECLTYFKNKIELKKKKKNKEKNEIDLHMPIQNDFKYNVMGGKG